MVQKNAIILFFKYLYLKFKNKILNNWVIKKRGSELLGKSPACTYILCYNYRTVTKKHLASGDLKF